MRRCPVSSAELGKAQLHVGADSAVCLLHEIRILISSSGEYLRQHFPVTKAINPARPFTELEVRRLVARLCVRRAGKFNFKRVQVPTNLPRGCDPAAMQRQRVAVAAKTQAAPAWQLTLH